VKITLDNFNCILWNLLGLLLIFFSYFLISFNFFLSKNLQRSLLFLFYDFRFLNFIWLTFNMNNFNLLIFNEMIYHSNFITPSKTFIPIHHWWLKINNILFRFYSFFPLIEILLLSH